MEKKPQNTAGNRNEDPVPPEKMNGTLFAPAGANSVRLFRQSDVPAFSKAGTFFLRCSKAAPGISRMPMLPDGKRGKPRSGSR